MIVSLWSRMRRRTANELWWTVGLILLVIVSDVMTLSGPNICIVQQKYNITKRVKYRAPMSIRTYEWCLAVPPRCSRYSTEMRDLTRLETEERTAEIAVCCPGYKVRGDFTCAPICPLGKTGAGCTLDCPPNKWGPNCVHDCKDCTANGKCSPITGECICHTGWRGERCETSMPTTTTTTTMRASLLTTPIAVLTASLTDTSLSSTTPVNIYTTVTVSRESINQVEDVVTHDSQTRSTENSDLYVTKVRIEDSTVKGLDHEYRFDKQFPKQGANDENKTKDQDHVMNSLNKTIPVMEITTKTDDLTKESSYDNDTITPWPSVATTDAFKKAITKTSSISTNLYTTGSTISPKPEISKKILPFTKPETTTKSTSITSREMLSTKKAEQDKIISTTVKFKPKEIWIKPAQKGETQITESKFKSHEIFTSKGKYSTLQELPATTTTPRTIIVSIIPTSMSYPTFKKIALTTASSPYPIQKYKTSRAVESHRATKSNQNLRSLTPFLIGTNNSIASTTEKTITITTVAKAILSTLHDLEAPPMLTKTTKYMNSEATNSMSMTNEVNKLKYPPSVPNITSSEKDVTVAISTNASPVTTEILSSLVTEKIKRTTTPLPKFKDDKDTSMGDKAQYIVVSIDSSIEGNATTYLSKENITTTEEPLKKLTMPYVTEDFSTNIVTNANTQQDEEETFHILTEPEHITAVAGDRPSKISTVDLIYVLTIVGGMVMSIITIAVVIVMIERCKRHRYSNMMKMDHMRMQVVIDSNGSPPPPYVRSIFHTPLPEPPMSDKCHYQPISTLDRNLKQFMRPVVVQTISPLMLENFRGILECHYDHLPLRSHDFNASGCGRTCCSVAPSIDVGLEPQSSRDHSLTESAIEALKCEADVDEIDASEPLYAEIPCWRPPSAHAVEVLNVNGEASTEL